MKRYFAVILLLGTGIIIFLKIFPIVRDEASIFKDGVNYVSMVDNKYFYIYKYGKWKREFVKGVNIGAGKPGTFPGELTITKDDYLRWFRYIGKMNANTIRVYTILKPDFYDALYEYNRSSIRPIYLMIGVWVNEEDIANLGDAYNPKIYDRFRKDIGSTIDIIHGNCTLLYEKGHASGTYKSDISPYVTGWILGIEWDPWFVTGTNSNNPKERSFKGKYLYTKNASPFENWLARMGDYAVDYETQKYKMQRPLSFTNWVTTDVLRHPNEPLQKEDMASVNTENIKRTDMFKPGLFASYHIYPYYPDFMNYQREYRNFRDKDGKINTYRAYLRDLRRTHTVPVLVAEFGVPSSRGMAHVNIHMAFNQGRIEEKSQGYMDEFMLRNIYEEGYAGGLVFTWQDEWFKRTWNTMDFDIPDRRPFWSNPQTNEQEFGLLAFDPGIKKSISYVDGNIEEWGNRKPLASGNNFSLYAMSDEKYLYLMSKIKNFNFNNDKIIIPIDTLGNQGNTEINSLGINLKRPADFLIMINGKYDSRIMVDSYYDSFYYMYSNLKMLKKNKDYEVKNSGRFNYEFLCLNRPLYLPQDKIWLPLLKYETGILKYGNGNPEDKDYDSLADFCINGDVLEIRVPWQLLNVMDPSSKMVMDDLYKSGIKPVGINGFYFGEIYLRKGIEVENSNMGFFSWSKWEAPTFHERLKPSYYILKDAFKVIGVK